jgi:hypothetical protein
MNDLTSTIRAKDNSLSFTERTSGLDLGPMPPVGMAAVRDRPEVALTAVHPQDILAGLMPNSVVA